jgi:hypothetical protein
MTHLGTWNTSYGQKKGRESNWQFDSRPLKVKNRPDSLTCMWHATYRWKALDEGYNFSLDLISIQGLHKKLWLSKVARISIVKISGLQLGSRKTKWHLGAGPMARHIVYYKGGRWWLPSSLHCGESCESVFSHGLSMHQKCSSYALTNLFSWFVQVRVSDWVVY